MPQSMDINCDMGESFGNWKMGDDAGMMPHITTANIACGFHASDPVTMIDTVKMANEHGIAMGAHPGLPDLLGFGRRAMDVTPEDAYAYIVYQVGALQATLATQGLTLHHIKPHGAFFLLLWTREELAEAVAQAIADLSDNPILYCPAPTEDAMLAMAARKLGIRVVGEVYPDLTYAPDGALVLQRAKHETDLEFAASQVRRYVEDGRVEANDGSLIELDAQSICVHGDGPNSVAVADAVCATLHEMGCGIEPALVN